MSNGRWEAAVQEVLLPAGLTADAIRNAVRARSSAVGTDPDRGHNFRVGRAFAEALGYPKSVLDEIPPSYWEAFTGVATPSLVADVQPGEIVVDLGCGGGLDLALLGWMVGSRGHASGID